MKMKKYIRRRFNWDIKNSWFNWKYRITLNIWQKKNLKTVNFIEHFLILSFTITGCVFISAFASLVNIPIEITSSAIGLNICTITTAIK